MKATNLGFFLNGNLISPNGFELAKGLDNILAANLSSCATMPSLRSYWIINSVDSNGLEQPMDTYCFVSRPTGAFQISSNELAFGTYVISVYAYDADYDGNFVGFVNYRMQVVSSPILVGLNAGAKLIELNWDETLVLDFYENSYDPDVAKPADKSGMKFIFVCAGNVTLADQIGQQITNLDTNNLNHSLKLAYTNNDWLYFYENDCFFK